MVSNYRGGAENPDLHGDEQIYQQRRILEGINKFFGRSLNKALQAGRETFNVDYDGSGFMVANLYEIRELASAARLRAIIETGVKFRLAGILWGRRRLPTYVFKEALDALRSDVLGDSDGGLT